MKWNNPDYSSLAMDSLNRLIFFYRDNHAYEEWRRRYGHDWPIYAVINGEEMRIESPQQRKQ